MTTATHTPTTLLPEGTVPLAFDVVGGERRDVQAMAHPDGALTVYERTEGELTACVFGAPWHEQRVMLSASQVPVALGMMDDASHLHLLQSYFRTGDRHLSDFMDALDAALIPYRYEALTPGEPPIQRNENPVPRSGGSA